MKKIILVLMLVAMIAMMLCGCIESERSADSDRTLAIADKLQKDQPTPTDINYSLERYNLIRRAYWVNGQREKANTLPCAVDKPLGYIVLFAGNAVVSSFVVDGKVSSLNSFLTPDSEYYEIDTDSGAYRDNKWIADVDGSYGENDSGIFFFTPDGKYIEWTGGYLYSDIPFVVDNPVLNVKEGQ